MKTAFIDDYSEHMSQLGVERLSVHEGIVTGYNRCGCYIKLNDAAIDCFFFGSGNVGDRVLVSILRLDRRHQGVICGLDSILEYAPISA